MSEATRRWSMRGIAIVFAATALTLAAQSTVAAAPGVAAAPKICLPVYLTATGDAVPDPVLIKTEAEVFLLGHRVAETKAEFTSGGVTEELLAFAGPIVFTPTKGTATLTANVTGEVNLATGKFQAQSTSVTGTGALQGTSGTLRFRGTQDLQSGSFSETITGALCSSVRPW